MRHRCVDLPAQRTNTKTSSRSENADGEGTSQKAKMFNQGNNGLDLINHAIHIGSVGNTLQRSDLLRQLGDANPGAVAAPPEQPVQGQAAQEPATVQTSPQHPTTPSRTGPERLNPNAFQFPWKLHDMLDNASADGFTSIVSWHEDGQSFRVHKPQEFVESVMPIYFKQTKYKSFQRQLNLYGFSRINEGPTKGGYKHQYFLRGQRNLCQLISRNSTGEGTVGTEASNSSTYATRPKKDSTSDFAHDPEPSPNPQHPFAQDVHPEEAMTKIATGLPRRAKPNNEYDSGDSSFHTGSVANSIDDKNDENKANKEFQFPWKLYEMLEKSESDSFEFIVSWQPDCVSFKVHDPQQFVTSIMPRFFKQTKYKSFQRQLNLYGFTRVDDGPNKGSYRHPYLVKGQKDLLNNLSRQKIKTEKPGKAGQPNNELSRDYDAETVEARERYEASPMPYDGVPPALAEIKKSESTDGSRVNHPEADGLHGLSWRQSPSDSQSDMIIEVIDVQSKTKTVYNVHRRALATGKRRSEFFATQFRNLNFLEKYVLELRNDEASVFPLLLDHIYTDAELRLSTETAYSLYTVAERLEVSSALRSVSDFFAKMMTKDNIVDFFTLAKNFKDTTLLEATICRCAEELRSLDHISVAKLDPDLLLRVMVMSKGLPRNYKCGSNKLSQFVAECVQTHFVGLLPSLFYSLTSKEHLPCIEPIAAIKLLAAESKLQTGDGRSSQIESSSLRERCVTSIVNNWPRLRDDVAESPLISSHMKSIAPEVLVEILLKATEGTRVSV